MFDFSKLKIGDDVIAFDAAGAIMWFACHHAKDYMKGNYEEALKEWQILLNFFCEYLWIQKYVNRIR
jgi:uncharacterized membrane protein